MGWKVRITALAPQARQQVTRLAELLAKLPGINAQQAEIGLKSPPYDLPEVKTEADAQKLVQGLSKMGLTCEIHPQPVRPSAPPPSVATPPASKTQPKVAATRPHNPLFEIETKPDVRIPIELRVQQESIKQPRKFQEYRSSLILLGIALAMIAGAIGTTYWLQSSPATQSEVSAPIAKTEKKARIPKTPQQRSKEKKNHALALQQLATSQDLLQQAEKVADVKASATLMLKALEYNPYNSEAWQKLSVKFRRMGDNKRAVECESRYQYSEKTQRTLEGIARYFGGKPKARINTARVYYAVSDDTLSAESFHEKSETLYDTVHTMHPEKTFKIENEGKAKQVLEVNPGEDFPAFDTWEQLDQKAKSK